MAESTNRLNLGSIATCVPCRPPVLKETKWCLLSSFTDFSTLFRSTVSTLPMIVSICFLLKTRCLALRYSDVKLEPTLRARSPCMSSKIIFFVNTERFMHMCILWCPRDRMFYFQYTSKILSAASPYMVVTLSSSSLPMHTCLYAHDTSHYVILISTKKKLP